MQSIQYGTLVRYETKQGKFEELKDINEGSLNGYMEYIE